VRQPVVDPVHDDERSFRGRVLNSVSGNDVEIEQSAVRDLHGDDVEIEQSALAVARAHRFDIRGSTAGLLIGRHVHARDVNTLLLLTPSLRGSVRTVIDLRTAFAFGLGIVLGRRLLRLLRLH